MIYMLPVRLHKKTDAQALLSSSAFGSAMAAVSFDWQKALGLFAEMRRKSLEQSTLSAPEDLAECPWTVAGERYVFGCAMPGCWVVGWKETRKQGSDTLRGLTDVARQLTLGPFPGK